MTVTLVDTSAWIEVFRRGGPKLEEIVAIDDVVTCLPVIQEVLQGFGNERAFAIARDSLLAFPIVEAPLDVEVIDHAVSLYRAARKRGVTVRSSVDCLIAACAIRNGLEVVHRDRDYPALARVSDLKERGI